MEFTMRSSVFSWVILTLFASTIAYVPRDDRYVEVHEINVNELPSPQLPPVEPANHGFPTTPTVPLLPTCTKRGFFRDPFNCGKFYLCEYEEAIPMAFYCKPGLIFNTDTDYCDHPEFVQC